MSELLEDLSDVDCLPSHNVQCPEFRFGGGGHDIFDDLGYRENGAVVRRVYSVVGEEEMSPSAAASLRFAEIACVAVDGKYHVAGGVRDDRLLL